MKQVNSTLEGGLHVAMRRPCPFWLDGRFVTAGDIADHRLHLWKGVCVHVLLTNFLSCFQNLISSSYLESVASHRMVVVAGGICC